MRVEIIVSIDFKKKDVDRIMELGRAIHKKSVEPSKGKIDLTDALMEIVQEQIDATGLLQCVGLRAPILDPKNPDPAS